MSSQPFKRPPVATPEAWRAAIERFRVKEKAATRARDALAAERRRLPMLKVEKNYVFDGEDGQANLIELFDGRRQLILYHVMYHPDWSEACVGCSMSVDGIGHLAHLHARDTSLVLVSRAPLSKLKSYKMRMGWTVPWFSSSISNFNADFGATVEDEEISLVSVFLRDGADVYRTYFTTNRGDEMLGTVWSHLDITPFGRQETWEDSPQGWPQSPPYEWWRRHDSYM
jgi:predicted dithiol-disulfide oxidoreductase (DUF899 family)